MSRTLEELDVMDDFLMNALAGNPEVGEDLEPHLKDGKESLPRHNRFYQAKIDSRYLKSGEKDFRKLPNLYVITLLDYDPFGKDYMMYSFHNSCEEIPELEYEDGLRFIYFYTNGKLGGCQQIKNMLMYIRNSKRENVVDEATREVHEYVEQVKLRPEVKLEYMKFEEIIEYERREAAKEAALKAAKSARIMDIQEVLEEYGELPESLKQRLEKEEDEAALKKWLKLAAKVSSIEEFLEKMDF